MSLSHHPNIVRNGLVAYFDAANPKSYPAGQDPYVNNVSLMLDGESLVDQSANARTFTASVGASVSTANKKFGNSSIYCTGSTSYIYNSSFNSSFGGDFTIEFWAYHNSFSSVNILMHIGNESSGRHAMFINSSGKVQVDLYFTGVIGTFNTTISTGTWNHYVLTRSGTTVKLFVNGTLDSVTVSVSGTFGNGNGVYIGAASTAVNGSNAYFDDIRITSGISRYAASFTPPTAPLSLPGRITDLTKSKFPVYYSSGTTFNSSNAGTMALNGTSAYGSGNNFLSVGPTSSFTVCTWVKYNSTVTSGPARCSAVAKAANTNDFEAVLGFPYTYSSSKLGLEVGKAGVQSQTAYSINSNPTGIWYHLCGVFMNGSGNFYINSVYQSTVTYNATVNTASTNSNAWAFGTEPFNGSAGGPFVNGNIGPTCIYNRILSNDEIFQNYNATKSRYGY